MAALITHKRGDTFAYAGTVTLPAGNWTGAAQLRKASDADAAQPTATLTVTLTPPVGPDLVTGVLIEASATASAAWPIGQLLCDVQFSNDAAPAVVLSTQTFTVDVVKDITHV